MENFNRYILFLVTALCVLDCLTTVAGYFLGGTEYNPMMAFLLNVSVFAFIPVKLFGTCSIYFGFSFTKKAVNEMEQTEPYHPRNKSG